MPAAWFTPSTFPGKRPPCNVFSPLHLMLMSLFERKSYNIHITLTMVFAFFFKQNITQCNISLMFVFFFIFHVNDKMNGMSRDLCGKHLDYLGITTNVPQLIYGQVYLWITISKRRNNNNISSISLTRSPLNLSNVTSPLKHVLTRLKQKKKQWFVSILISNFIAIVGVL